MWTCLRFMRRRVFLCVLGLVGFLLAVLFWPHVAQNVIFYNHYVDRSDGDPGLSLGSLSTPVSELGVVDVGSNRQIKFSKRVPTTVLGIVQRNEDVRVFLDNLFVFEKLFEGIVKSKADSDKQIEVPKELTESEHNALRYAAGYVIRKLKERFIHASHPHKEDFLLCLGKMIEGRDINGDTYLEYTRQWIEIVDRGGLMRINDEVYRFVYEVEVQVRKHLLRLFTQEKEVDKKSIIDCVATDGDVQFHWCFVVIDLDEEVANELLLEIVKLWLTVRGFSMAGAFVEHYKQCSEKGTKKTTGLRKGLKRRHLEFDSTTDPAS